MKQILLAISILLLASCTYYDNEEYFVDHTPGPLPEISLITSFDTIIGDIIATDSILFEYEVFLDSGRVFFTYLEFQELQGFINDTNAASIWLKPNKFLPGNTAELFMSVAYKTNSGSLADLYDVEYTLFDTSWTLIVKEDAQ
jgi:hypothetical protein